MIYLDDLRTATGAQLFGHVAADRFSSFAAHPAHVTPGQLYVALSTGLQDGHQGIDEAIQRGATGVLCQEPPLAGDMANVTVVVVGNTLAALGQWAAHVLRQYNTTVIAVAGTIGKSSTRHAIATLLKPHYRLLNPADHHPGLAGILLSLGELQPDHQIALIEMALEYPGEVPDLLGVIRPRIGVMTNISPDGSDVGDTEQSQAACMGLLNALASETAIALNADDPHARALQSQSRSSVITFGTSLGPPEQSLGLWANNIRFYSDKTGFDLQHGTQRYPDLWLPSPGRPGLYAGLAALAVAVTCNIPLHDAVRELPRLTPLSGRFNPLGGVKGSRVVDDTFDATPVSARAALEWLASVEGVRGRRIFALGDLRVREERTAEAHREIGLFIAQSVDILLTCGESALQAARAARQAGMPLDRVVSAFRRDDLAATVAGTLRRDDVAVVTGAGHARMEAVTRQLLDKGDDAQPLLKLRGPATPPPDVPSWIELNLDALAHNLRHIRQRLSQAVRLLVRVEGNGYGHGLLQAATTAVFNGADMLGVSSSAEAYHLREAGIDSPILVMGFTSPADAARTVLADLTITLHAAGTAPHFASIARQMNRVLKVQVPVAADHETSDLMPDQALSLIREIVRTDGLDLTGVYTHLPLADDSSRIEETRDQLRHFNRLLDNLRAVGISPPDLHAADSAALLTLPESHLTMVRADLLAYGIAPSAAIPCPPQFRPCLTWKTHVARIHRLPGKTILQKGSERQIDQERRVAILPVGYADGMVGDPGTRIEVLIRGQRASLVGETEMNQCHVDISHLPGVQSGEEVVLLGRQDDQTLTVEELARRQNRTSQQVLVGLPSHIPRIVL